MEQYSSSQRVDHILSGALKSCSKCIYDESIPSISFGDDGVCNYCDMIEEIEREYGTGGEKGIREFNNILSAIRSEGKGRKYDCVIGVSGGTDSSYLIHMAVKEWGLRPLAVHYDNSWNSAIATQNISKVLGKLNVDLYTHVVNNKESDDLFRSFLKAGVPELDGPTDIAAPQVLYSACAKHKIKYVIEGHSFKTEGISPLGNMYIDGKYVKSVHRMYGLLKRTPSFPNMTFYQFMKWILFYRIKKIRPLWYLDYSKEKARELLMKEYDWEYYGGHHLENRLSAFHHSYWNPKKFNLDQRNNSLGASVRSGLMSRNEALEEFSKEPHLEEDLLNYFLKRMDITEEELDEIIKSPNHSYKEFTTYKQRFERLRPLFYLLYKKNLVPKSFYIKYTSKTEM